MWFIDCSCTCTLYTTLLHTFCFARFFFSFFSGKHVNISSVGFDQEWSWLTCVNIWRTQHGHWWEPADWTQVSVWEGREGREGEEDAGKVREKGMEMSPISGERVRSRARWGRARLGRGGWGRIREGRVREWEGEEDEGAWGRERRMRED